MVLPVVLLSANLAAGQNHIYVQPPEDGRLGWLTRPYRASTVPPARFDNSQRLLSLVRAGNLYLTAQDVVALAIENNIDVEVQRYGPLMQQEVLKRARAGGALRSVGIPVAAGPQSVSLQGVSLVSAVSNLSAGSGVSSGGGIVTQLGPPLLTLDPTILLFANFQHASIPQSNIVLTGTTALIQDTRSYQAQYSQSWAFGLTAQVTYSSQRVALNSERFVLNPYTPGLLDLQLTQNLLQGFGPAVNGRNIRVQRNNVKVSDLQFKQQVIVTVSAALNLYWDLVSFYEDVRSRLQELATARQLYQDNQRQVTLGSLAAIEITRAEAQLYAGQQDLIIAQTNLLQQEMVLKNALTRNGVAAAGLSSVHIVPLDRITIPDRDEIGSVEELIQEGVRNRLEIEQARINLESNQLNLIGIKNSLQPTLQAFAELTNNGLTGRLNPGAIPKPAEVPSNLPEGPERDALVAAYELAIAQRNAALNSASYFEGGYGNLLGQIARRNFPNYSVGFSLNIPLRNRAAQGDYATSLLEIRQNELNLRKNINQVRVDVENAVVGLQQARARYEASARSRVLQEQILAGDQKKLKLGATTPFQVVLDQRDLASTQSAEVQAMANYTHARIAFDQALGRTLDVNHVSLGEALRGRVAKPSSLPADLPKSPLPENALPKQGGRR
jgi:outer membrane protein TolC